MTFMRRRLVLPAIALLAAAVGLLALATESRGDAAKAPTCYGVSGDFTVRYDARNGATLQITEERGRKLTGLIPHTINGQRNPHFDPLFALAINRGSVREVCLDGDRSNSPVVGITVRY
jgi:hypothetical protein